MYADESEESVLLEILAGIPDAPRQVLAAALAAYLGSKHTQSARSAGEREWLDGAGALG
jgi:hypothetical protein